MSVDVFAEELEIKIKKWVCVIWYEVSNDIDPETTFTRINMGKIPLNNAELIKALLLNGDRQEQLISFASIITEDS